MATKLLILAVLAAGILTGCCNVGEVLDRSQAWHALSGTNDHVDSLVNCPGYGRGPQLVPANVAVRKEK